MSEFFTDQPEDATPLDVGGLKDRRIKTRKALFASEAENIRKVIVKYLASRPSKRRVPFSFSWLFTLHRQMFGDVWAWAGVRRNTEKNVGVPVHQIDVSLLQLVNDLPAWRDGGMDPIELSARLHHRAVQIHPFENGNGRWARMLASIWLKREGFGPTVWPEETIGRTSIIRAEYIAAVRAADRFEFESLMELHRRYTPTTR